MPVYSIPNKEWIVRTLKLNALLIAISCCLSTQAWGDIPHQMNLQGVLVDTSGAAMKNDTVSVTFTIYDAALGGSAKWTETDTVATDEAGVFSIVLGGSLPIPDSVFSDTLRWLGIQVEAEPELTPRTQLVSAPYSFVSGNVGTGSASGWIDNGSVVALETTADSVGIGTSTPTEMLEVAGNVRISGTASIGANHTLTGASGFVAGDSNTVSGVAATVGGGFSNLAGGDHSAVGGGMDNNASGQWSTVSGGDSSTASGSRATTCSAV